MQGKKQTKLAAFLSFTGEPWSCQLQYCSQAVNSVSVVSNNPLALLHTFQSIYNICSRAEGTDLPPSVYPPSCSMRFERCKPLCTRSFVWRPNQPNLPTSWLVCTRVFIYRLPVTLFPFHVFILSCPKNVHGSSWNMFNTGSFFPKAVAKHMLSTKDMGGRTSHLDY